MALFHKPSAVNIPEILNNFQNTRCGMTTFAFDKPKLFHAMGYWIEESRSSYPVYQIESLRPGSVLSSKGFVINSDSDPRKNKP